MIKKCTNCGEEFNAKRETARYCSDKCKKAKQRVSGTVSVTNNEVSVTKAVSVTQSNVTVKDDNKTRLWLIEQFKLENKPPAEIEKIMQAQDDYYSTREHYFIPARMKEVYQAAAI